MDGSFGSYTSHQYNGTGRQKPKGSKEIAQTIGTNIQKISQNVSSMKRMVNLLGTTQDSQDLRQQLHQIQHYTQNLVKDTSSNLRELQGIPVPASPSEQREWKMQKERLAEEFTATVNAFQEIQRYELQKEREEVRRTRANSNIAPPPSNDLFHDSRFSDQLIELQDSSGTRRYQMQEQLQDEMNMQLLQEQEQAVQQLEQNISEVNDIFKELAAMVHDQGEIVDSIEASVEKTEVMVEEGASQLRQASNYSTKLRKKKCILLACLAGILTVLIAIIYWT